MEIPVPQRVKRPICYDGSVLTYLMPMTIGVDIGGTKIRAGRVTRGIEVATASELPTEARSSKKTIIANIIRAIEDVWSDEVRGIGIGIAGLTDPEKGMFVSGPNFGAAFRNIALKTVLQARFKKPVALDNDAHCFTLAEANHGVGKGKKTVIGMTLGTGVGGGIAVDGAILRGKQNGAGELGHMHIGGDVRCSCGQTGHLETYASGTAMQRRYKIRTGTDLDAKTIEKKAVEGDPAAKEVIEEMAHGLANGFASIIHVLNPDVIVIGGGLSRMTSLIKPAASLAKTLLAFPHLKHTTIVRSTLRGDAPVIGAAHIAKNA
jgi:glucokinase